MKSAILAAVLLAGAALISPVNAATLTVGVLPADQVVPQSASAPCIICATTQAHNPVGFGYNNFNSTGNDASFNLFSSNITGAFGNDDDLTVTPYTGTLLKNFLTSVGDVNLTFGVAIDVNSTSAKSEVLTQFRLLDLDQAGDGPLGSLVLFSILNPVPLPDIRNGNGSADYLITGFNLSGLANLGDRLLFQATWSGAVDGGESFYIVPSLVAVPIPAVGAGLPGVIAAFSLLGLWAKRRRHNLGLPA
jgi:hypothetical protein